MIGKINDSLVIATYALLMVFFLFKPVFSQTGETTSSEFEELPQWGYMHIGIAGNMFEVNPGNMNRLIEPFEVATPINFEHFFYLCGGFKNIAQVEYRWGEDSNNLFYDEIGFPPTQINRTIVDMEFDYSQVLFKVNPLFFMDGLEAWAFFIVWGNGSVDYVESNGDGFQDGTQKIIGMEIATITKYFTMSASYEQNSMVFKKFSVQGFEPITDDFDVSTWQLNIKLSVGFGI